MAVPRTGARALYRRLLACLWPHRGRFLVSQLALAVVAASEPALPALMQPLLDGSFLSREPAGRLTIPVLLVLLYAVVGVFNYVGLVALYGVGHAVVADLRVAMFRRLVALPTRWYDDSSAGQVISRVTFDAQQAMMAATQTIHVLVKDGLAVVCLVAYLVWLDWRLASVLLVVGPLLVLAVRAVSGRLRRTSRHLQQSMGAVTHVVEEVLEGHEAVKVYGGRHYEIGRMERAADDARRNAVRVISAAHANVPIIQFIIASGVAFMIWFAGARAAGGALTVGEFVAFFTAMTMLVSPIKRLTAVNEHIQRGLAAAESIFGIVDAEEEADPGRHDPGRARGDLRFEGVSFRYAHGAEPALRDIDLHVPAGTTVALVGASGSGKSTLASLVARLHAPDGGRVVLDGVDLADWRLDALRRNVAYVGQRVVLFNDTVRNNVAYGALRAAREDDVRRALAAAAALDFVERLPGGLEAQVGENGVRLSGGERQRLAIARAILKDAPILVLDEATSALDTASERQIQTALEALRRGRTCVVVAHRLSTIERADRIVVMDGGRIVESGTHAELLRRAGRYAELHRLQFSRQTATDAA